MSTTIYTATRPADFDELRARLSGDVVVPGDESYDAARQAWNLAADQQPAAVVLAESAEDVVQTVRFAKEHGLRVAPQGTGHGAASLGVGSDAILLKTERMRRVEIDAENQRARVEAGVWWEEVVEPASEHGLVALHGSSPNVGVVGYSLGGGMGWLARKHGLSTNSVLAIEIVTADGELRRADHEQNQELFWALRGGGGNFGVVTAMEIKLYPLREVYAGWLIFPVERAEEVLKAWRDWTETAPREVTSVGRLLNLPPLPEIPEPIRGRSIVVVEAAFMGTEEDGKALLAPLRALGPEIDTFAQIPAKQLARLHQDPEPPSPAAGDGAMLTELPDEAIEGAIAHGGAGSPLVSTEIRHLGGALAEAKPHHGAAAALDAAYVMFAVGIPMSPEVTVAIEASVERLKEALEPWIARQMYFNFAETRRKAGSFYSELAYARLKRIRAEYDPAGMFQANHVLA